MDTTSSDDYIASCAEGFLDALTQAVRLTSEDNVGALKHELYYARGDFLNIIEIRGLASFS